MQLVELQRTVHDVDADRVAVVAVSYDPVEVLAGFARSHDIGYPLLADVGSVVIERLGLLNTTIESERAFWGKTVERRHHRLPYPGTFLLDESGTIVEKMFERSHRIRPGGRVLMERLGLDLPSGGVRVVESGPGLGVAASTDRPDYFPNQVQTLRLRLAVDDGYHVYVPPNPDGFIDLSVALDPGTGVFAKEVVLPEGHPFMIEGLDETFSVVEGTVELSVPFYVLEDSGTVDLRVAVSYQACNHSTCLPPATISLALSLDERRA